MHTAGCCRRLLEHALPHVIVMAVHSQQLLYAWLLLLLLAVLAEQKQIATARREALLRPLWTWPWPGQLHKYV